MTVPDIRRLSVIGLLAIAPLALYWARLGDGVAVVAAISCVCVIAGSLLRMFSTQAADVIPPSG